MKVIVRVKTPSGEYWKTKKVEKDGKTIVMQKGKGKLAGWKFTFDNRALIVKHDLFRTKYYLDVFHDSTKTIAYDYSLPDTEQPKLTKNNVKDVARWEALKQRYSTMGQQKTPFIAYLTFIGVVVAVVLLILSNRGVMI
jgi:hypothetical protein